MYFPIGKKISQLIILLISFICACVIFTFQKAFKMCPNIEYVPTEIIILIFNYLTSNDILQNCMYTCRRWQEIIIQFYLPLFLRNFAKLNINLYNSLTEEGWSERCDDYEFIISLWNKYNPYKGMLFTKVIFIKST